MADKKTLKRVHATPGVYFSEMELTYSAKSMGITRLGVAGETQKGPAFQPIEIADWAEFQRYFGGTNTEKFIGSQYPKYELPYIAKEYLTQSQQLQVCRVLGLSGVNAGAAWLITAYYKPDTNGSTANGGTTNEGTENKPAENGPTTDENGGTAKTLKAVETEGTVTEGDGNEGTENGGATNEGTVTKSETEYTKDKPLVIAVIRSRGEHLKAAFKKSAAETDGCEDVYEYDEIRYYAKDVKIRPSDTLDYNDTCNPSFSKTGRTLSINSNNYGVFTLVVTTWEGKTVNYSVSLNPGDKNYIINVLGQEPDKGESEIYVEELYDIALEQLIERGKINTLADFNDGDDPQPLKTYPEVKIIPNHAAVDAILTMDESMLTRRMVGKRFLFSKYESVNSIDSTPLKVHVSDDKGVTWTVADGKVGHIYTVVPHTLPDGTRVYYYGEYGDVEENKGTKYVPEFLSSEHKLDTEDVHVFKDAVEVKEDGMYYVCRKLGEIKGTSTDATTGDDSAVKNESIEEVVPITMDMNNYKGQYRYASTPWIVSEMKGSATEVELTKLFRFHTISDGNTANTEVKISIENIDPEQGTFDVLVRDYNDSDTSITTLEKYKGCNLIPGSPNYIAYRIGSTDENYETKSKYVTVEVNETDKTKVSIPAGFLGYPVRYYDGYAITGTGTGADFVETQVDVYKPYLQYNTDVRDDLRINKQYFGMSDLVGIDSDLLKYKGVEAYADIPGSLTPCFHLDSRIFEGIPDDEGRVKNPLNPDGETNPFSQKVSVDGITGYQWVTVGAGNTLDLFGIQPRFGEEETMINTIYEDKRARKFTLCFYGGWDGWDYYRQSRSNSDDFVYRKYRGKVDPVSGEGSNFNLIKDPESYGLEKNGKFLNSDYYAYLSAIRMFANPKTIDINHLATPGIDYVNNTLLVGEVIDMVEEERGDSVYVVTTPDKPFGASDSVLEMFTPSDAVDNLDDSEIDSNYVCSSYPWNKYFDSANSQYIYLPPTKDMVRNFAYTDNIKFPWYAAVGWNRGTVNAISPKKSLKLVEQDELYEGRLNFTNTFAQDGLRLWGDKNFQKHESPMNRISHRRALNRIKTLLNKACVGLIFDPNDTSMGKSLESAIKPVLDNVKENKGLVDYKIVIDDSVEARERLELNAQLYLKLMPNLEYINITLVVLPSGMQISEL